VTSGSTGSLDLQIIDTPAVAGEIFQIDDVSIVKTSPAPALPLVQMPLEHGLTFAARMIPNPVRTQGDLVFTTTKPGAVRIQVFDVEGRLVRQPLDEAFVPAGSHAVSLAKPSGETRLSSGTYFYRLDAAEGVKSGRFVVTK